MILDLPKSTLKDSHLFNRYEECNAVSSSTAGMLGTYSLYGYVNTTRPNISATAPVLLTVVTTSTTLTTTSTTLPAPPAGAVRTNFTYDSNGNMLSDGEYVYEYDAQNMLKRVKSGNSTVEQYWYDSTGNRVKKTQYLAGGGNRTTYYPSSSYETLVDETGVAHNTKYVFANGERLVEFDENNTKKVYLDDHLGSSSVVVSATGQVLDRLAYYPFGDIKSGGSNTKYGYNSKELDSTGLNYYGARYYNSQLKRWTQADTVIQNTYDPQSLNRYAYTRNNPLKYTDPMGHAYGIDDIHSAAIKMVKFVEAFTITTLNVGYSRLTGRPYSQTKCLDDARNIYGSIDKMTFYTDGFLPGVVDAFDQDSENPWGGLPCKLCVDKNSGSTNSDAPTQVLKGDSDSAKVSDANLDPTTTQEPKSDEKESVSSDTASQEIGNMNTQQSSPSGSQHTQINTQNTNSDGSRTNNNVRSNSPVNENRGSKGLFHMGGRVRYIT